MTASRPDDILSWEDLIYVVDFLEVSGERRFSILGGEPTLHPDFNDILLYGLERGFDLTVFTSGIMSNSMLEEAAHAFRDVPEQRLTFVCNLNDPMRTKSPLAELESTKRFLEVFGERVVPGFNIYQEDFDLGFLFRFINEYGLKRTIRMGVAHPIPGKSNRHISITRLDAIIRRLFEHRPQFERLRIKPGLDCGFPMCRFEDDELAWLFRFTGSHQDFGCGPVVDIGPDLMVWPCFPLSSYQKRSLYDFDSLKQVHEHFQHLHDVIRTEVAGIFPECDDCVFREDRICMGGCQAHALSRFIDEHPLRLGEVYA